MSVRATQRTPEEALRSVSSSGYAAAASINGIVWVVSTLAGDSPVSLLYALLSVPFGIAIVRETYRAASVLVTPLTLYAAVWLVLVPATSFAAPLMRPMNSEEVGYCAIAGVAFALGGLLVTPALPKTPPSDSPELAPEVQARMLTFANVVLLISIAALLANMVVEGRVALFDAAGDTRKSAAQFLGFPLLSSIGTVSLAIYARIGKMTRIRAAGAGIFLVLELLTGQRFGAVVALILVVASLASNRTITKNLLRRVGGLSVAIVIAFVFVGMFRGGASDQQKYFVATGLYSGDAKLLQSTEVVRYAGMSQRNMGVVLDQPFESENLLNFTLSPLTGIAGQPPSGLGTSTYGYTATNAIAYLHRDLGPAWPLGIAAWSILVNIVFIRSRTRPNFSSTFAWCVCVLGVSTSFFAYVNAYIYWVALFPIMVSIVERSAARGSKSSSLTDRVAR